MAYLEFSAAIDRAVEQAMAVDDRIIIIGEDVPLMRQSLFVRFGEERVICAPISEAAFLAAGTGAAMAGLRPIVEILLVDFIAVAMDAVLNQMAKIEMFSGGAWHCPIVVRASCGGGYGDGGQHEQNLWGMLAGIPGIKVVVPSNPADAAGLMRAAIEDPDPVIFLEHKLLSEMWLGSMGIGGRDTVSFDVPEAGRKGPVPGDPPPVPIGSAAVKRRGNDVTIVSLAVGVHRSLEAAERLAGEGISCEVIDLRSVAPLDTDTIIHSVSTTGRLLVVDEDYRVSGLSGELAAITLEAGLTPRYSRVCLEDSLPYARHLEDEALPGVPRILEAARAMMSIG